MPRTPANPDHFSMSFGDHLEELRKRLFLALAAPIPLMFAFFFISKPIIALLIEPLSRELAAQGLPSQLQTLSPPEFVMTQLKLSFIAALVVSGPWVLYQFWQFVRPGLYAHEQRFIYFLAPLSAALIFAGVAVTHWILLPLMLKVLIAFGASMTTESPPLTTDPELMKIVQANPQPPVCLLPPENPQPGTAYLLWPDMELFVVREAPAAPGAAAVAAAPTPGVEIVHLHKPHGMLVAQAYRLSWYISFVLVLFLGTVVAFQLPMVMLLLGWIGLIDAATLRKKRKIAAIIIAFVSAIITPSPDPLTMLVMFIPLMFLYEFSILLLLVAPARKVAQGTVIALTRSDKAVARTAQAAPREPMDNPHPFASVGSETAKSAADEDSAQ